MPFPRPRPRSFHPFPTRRIASNTSPKRKRGNLQSLEEPSLTHRAGVDRVSDSSVRDLVRRRGLRRDCVRLFGCRPTKKVGSVRRRFRPRAQWTAGQRIGPVVAQRRRIRQPPGFPALRALDHAVAPHDGGFQITRHVVHVDGYFPPFVRAIT
jgi:hypothetical protein